MATCNSMSKEGKYFSYGKGDQKKQKKKENDMAKQEQKKPNILVIWGDDIGITQPELL